MTIIALAVVLIGYVVYWGLTGNWPEQPDCGEDDEDYGWP